MGKSNSKKKKIYLDYASSSLIGSANPGVIHELGIKEKNKLENARAVIAKILNANTNEVIFTSGATESNNLAIQGIISYFWERYSHLGAKLSSEKMPHIITTNIEHSSVLETCKHLEKTKQAEVTYIKVEKNGIIDSKKISKALKSNTVLVSVMYANNEIGTIQPIEEIAKEIRHFKKINNIKNLPTGRQVFFHTDATQAVNYLPINVCKLGVDLLTFNGAKIYGPKGVGILYVKRNTPIRKIMFGGDQEFGLRPGTENVALAVSISKAFQMTENMKKKEVKRLIKLRDYFLNKIFKNTSKSAIAENLVNNKIILNGDLKNRLPNNINITFTKIPSDLLVIELSARGIMTSSKSACKSNSKNGSYVIDAIRSAEALLPPAGGSKASAEEIGSLRFSLGRDTTKADIDYTIKALSEILHKLKKWYN
ncbi:MAG: cysteine desulfurase family protein [Candidatus Paceibacterota bacterium]|jgi:cysteine desulfurase